MAAAPDHDASRRRHGDDEALSQIGIVSGAVSAAGVVDVDDDDVWDSVGRADDDLSALSIDVLSVPVEPVRAGEFTCSGCWLVHHRSQARQYRSSPDAGVLCRDCV